MRPDNATVFVSARVLDELLAVAPYSQGHHTHVALLNSQVDVQSGTCAPPSLQVWDFFLYNQVQLSKRYVAMTA
jgi:hypothetical protein